MGGVWRGLSCVAVIGCAVPDEGAPLETATSTGSSTPAPSAVSGPSTNPSSTTASGATESGTTSNTNAETTMQVVGTSDTTSAGTTGTGTSSAGSSSSSSGEVFTCDDPPDPPGGDCPEDCDDCVGTTCVIDCDMQDECSGGVTCPDGWACEVNCVAQAACRTATIQCPERYACAVACEGQNACRDATVACAAGTCTVECIGSANDHCRDLEVECGLRDTRLSCEDSMDNQTVTPDPASMCSCEESGC